jgi:D-psicose/D-tagatose/L-ribulose 3-epimerase
VGSTLKDGIEMQIGCHGLVWTGNFDAAGFEYAVGKTLASGYDLIELPLLDPFGFDVEAAKKVLAKTPIALSASLGQSAETDISSDNPEYVAAGEQKLLRALDVIHALDGKYFVGVLYGELRKYMSPATPSQRANSIAVLQRVADRAAELKITLGLEVVNRYETNLLNTAKQAIDYLDELDRPNVKVHLDTYHMNIEESDMFLPVIAAGDRLGYVHIGESHRGYLGSGTVDFSSFFRALAAIKYDGPVVFESFSTAVVHPDLSRMLAVWRNLWDDSDDLGVHANSFMRNSIRAVDTISLH